MPDEIQGTKIPYLPSANNIIGDDLLVLEQTDGTKKATLSETLLSQLGLSIVDGKLCVTYTK